MPSSFSNLGLELQATGENANTWGDKTNVGLQRIDNAVAGYSTVQANSTTITLAFSTNSGSTTFSDENGRNKILKFTSGSAAAAITVTVPDIEKEYLVRNETGQNVTFSAGGSTTVTLATGKNAHIYIDGASAVYNGLADIVTTSLDTGGITSTGVTVTGTATVSGDLTVDTNTLYVDSSNNRVGVGTDSPSNTLTVNSGTSNVVAKFISSDADAQIHFEDNSTTDTVAIGATGNNLEYRSDLGVHLFRTGNSAVERLRIDNSGNVLLGKTSSDTGATAGFEWYNSGDALFITRSGNPSLEVNRLSSDGAIANFRKDGTVVGSIGTLSGDLALGTGDVTLWFNDGGNNILPRGTSFGANDNAIDLGNSSNRFKDLYLGGGAVISEATLTDGATISWDVSTSSVAKVTLGGNRTLSAPSNALDEGQFISLLVIQDGTGTRTLTWNAVYEFKDDTPPTLTSTGGKGDLFVFRYNGTKWLEVGRNLNLTLS